MDNIKKQIIGLRKLSFVVLLLLVTIALLVSSYINGSNFALIWAASAPAFFAASLAEHIVQKIMGRGLKRAR